MKQVFRSPSFYFIFFLCLISLYYNYPSIAFTDLESETAVDTETATERTAEIGQNRREFFISGEGKQVSVIQKKVMPGNWNFKNTSSFNR